MRAQQGETKVRAIAIAAKKCYYQSLEYLTAYLDLGQSSQTPTSMGRLELVLMSHLIADSHNFHIALMSPHQLVYLTLADWFVFSMFTSLDLLEIIRLGC